MKWMGRFWRRIMPKMFKDAKLAMRNSRNAIQFEKLNSALGASKLSVSALAHPYLNLCQIGINNYARNRVELSISLFHSSIKSSIIFRKILNQTGYHINKDLFIFQNDSNIQRICSFNEKILHNSILYSRINSISLNSFMQSIAYSITFCTTSLSVSFIVECTVQNFAVVNFFNDVNISITLRQKYLRRKCISCDKYILTIRLTHYIWRYYSSEFLLSLLIGGDFSRSFGTFWGCPRIKRIGGQTKFAQVGSRAS